jgi:hypothetical protein
VRRVLLSPKGQVIEKALDFGDGPIKTSDEQIAGLTDATATQVRPMIVVLDQLGSTAT